MSRIGDIARVAVDVRTRSLDHPFDYAIPPNLSGVAVGKAVVIPFGSRVVIGYVLDVHEGPVDDLKDIHCVSEDGVLPKHAVEVAQWMARKYLCGLAEALQPFLPPAVTHMPVEDGGSWSIESVSPAAMRERWVSAAPDADPKSLPANAVRMRAVLDAVSAGPVTMAELRAHFGEVTDAVRRLAQRGLVVTEDRVRLRRPRVRPREAPRHVHLTAGQRAALEAIESAAPGSGVLLDGVTGSGKTEVYLRAIDRVLSSGMQAIVLVPEIALTPQTAGRFRSRLGEAVGVLHSRLTPAERHDLWHAARHGKVSVVVGPRSALFTPLADIGLIVIDEEHSSSFKHGATPRYHARDVAARICEVTGAVLVLGSATPSLETLEEVRSGALTRVVMPERATGALRPDVTIVDMRAEFKKGNRSMFSGALAAELARVADRKSKAIILYNRRGYASFLLCRDCGYTPECPACSVSLTYHQRTSTLVCHHCGHKEGPPAECPACGSAYIRMFGAGTQRVEDELRRLVPELPVVRMDADTTSGKGGHEARLAEFEALPAGILLGTQMIAKGLDYPDVTLVGVMAADLGLRIPDFRAAERTFQLLEQVSGRAGRGDEAGRVVIQAYWSDHPAILAVRDDDRDLFYASEVAERRGLSYPPFGSLIRVLVSGRDQRVTQGHIERLAESLHEVAPDWRLVGPAPAPLSRIKGRTRWHLLLKGPAGALPPEELRYALSTTRTPDGVAVRIDVDPQDML
ncbi:MAG: primosomal protein N' [Coriobacteriia bacterium]